MALHSPLKSFIMKNMELLDYLNILFCFPSVYKNVTPNVALVKVIYVK